MSTEQSYTLTDSESSILKILIREQSEANTNIATFVSNLMSVRNLDVQEWGISTNDLKSIVRNQPAPPVLPEVN